MLQLENPLPLAAAAPLAALAIYSHFRLHRRLMPSLIKLGNPMLKVVSVQGRGRGRRAATLALKLAAVVLICLAAASPYVEVEEVASREVEAEIREALRVAGPAVVVALDVSGSMGEAIPGGVKIDAAKAAVRRFLEGLPGNVSVGLVAFDHTVVLAVPVTRDRARLLEALERLGPGGGTMYTYPLHTALSMLRPYRSFNASCAVVLVSDGLPADRGRYDGLLAEMRGLGIAVHTVYIGPGGDEGAREMERIAGLTGGRPFNAETAQSLVQVFEGLAHEVARVAVNYRAKATLVERVRRRVDLGWLFALLSAAVLTALLYARYRVLGLTI